MCCQKTLRPAGKRKHVDTIKADRKVSIHRACAVLKIGRSLCVYKSRRDEEAELKLKIKDICQTRVRYGYRHVNVLLKRDGWRGNAKRIYGLYKEMDLQLRNKVQELVFENCFPSSSAPVAHFPAPNDRERFPSGPKRSTGLLVQAALGCPARPRPSAKSLMTLS